MMRRAVLACCLALAPAGCGGGDEPAAGDPDQPVSAPAGTAAPAAAAPGRRACRRLGRRLVGDPLARARTRARRRGCPLRVAVLDGEQQMLTEDFQPARINVRVADGVVTGVAFMG